jgi:hypothetical protein
MLLTPLALAFANQFPAFAASQFNLKVFYPAF